jgi:hypothetical protein
MRHAHYEPDTIIADVEDPPHRTSRRRYAEELTMQVLMQGAWHRRKPNLARTACDQPINSQFSPLRREALIDPLCSVCFTESERQDAAEATAREYEGDKP